MMIMFAQSVVKRVKTLTMMNKEELEEIMEIIPPKPWWNDETVFYTEEGIPYTMKEFMDDLNNISGISEDLMGSS